MRLRTHLNLVVAGLTVVFVLVLLAEEIQSTRSSVQEEIDAANIVAAQLLGPLAVLQARSGGTPAVIVLLRQLGHVRANDIQVRDAAGRVLYRSPPFTYKAGRAAPEWFARLLAPTSVHAAFALPDGATLLIAGVASRSILDAWDDLTRLAASAGLLLVTVNAMAFWSVGRALRPIPVIVRGLGRVQQGELSYRLPPLSGPEAGAIGSAFNRMAQAVEDNMNAGREARDAQLRLEERREHAALMEQRLEEERRLIAHELHDELAQSVTAIRSLAMAIAARESEKPVADTARLIEREAGALYDAMHGLIPRLMPVTLDNLGLAATLENLVSDWRRRHPGVAVTLHQALPADLGPSVTLAAYRVVQEGLINALRHGQPRHVDIGVSGQPCEVTVTVADDGVGLPKDWARPGRFGLRGLIERVERLGGSLTLDSLQPGTRLTARIPLTAADPPSHVDPSRVQP